MSLGGLGIKLLISSGTQLSKREIGMGHYQSFTNCKCTDCKGKLTGHYHIVGIGTRRVICGECWVRGPYVVIDGNKVRRITRDDSRTANSAPTANATGR